MFFFLNDPPTTEIYPLSLHDALPISRRLRRGLGADPAGGRVEEPPSVQRQGVDAGGRPQEDHVHRVIRDRKSTRLNSSHANISYAVFCLKKKKSTHDHLSYYHYAHIL